jgi:chromosome segregation ATPase
MPLGAEEAIAELHAQVKLLMDENALMVEQKVHLSQELDKQQELLEKQAIDNTGLKSKLGDALQDITRTKEGLMEVESERNAAAAEAMHLSEILGKQEQEIDSLKEGLTVAKQKLKEKEQALTEMKRLFDSLSLKYSTESDQTIDRVQQIEKHVKDLQSQLYTKNHDLEQANDVIRKLRQEYQTTRRDAEGK